MKILSLNGPNLVDSVQIERRPLFNLNFGSKWIGISFVVLDALEVNWILSNAVQP